MCVCVYLYWYGVYLHVCECVFSFFLNILLLFSLSLTSARPIVGGYPRSGAAAEEERESVRDFLPFFFFSYISLFFPLYRAQQDVPVRCFFLFITLSHSHTYTRTHTHAHTHASARTSRGPYSQRAAKTAQRASFARPRRSSRGQTRLSVGPAHTATTGLFIYFTRVYIHMHTCRSSQRQTVPRPQHMYLFRTNVIFDFFFFNISRRTHK